jgi:hypothetical protein
MLVILVLRRQRSERSRFKANPRQIVCEILVWKHPTQNRNGTVTEVVTCLPSKNELYAWAACSNRIQCFCQGVFCLQRLLCLLRSVNLMNVPIIRNLNECGGLGKRMSAVSDLCMTISL